MLLSFADDPALTVVRGESWPAVTDECWRRADLFGNYARDSGLRPLNRVALAVGNNCARRAEMAGVTDLESGRASSRVAARARGRRGGEVASRRV